MKKNFKKILALVMAALMLLSMTAAFAAGHSSITINNAVKDHTYTAYRILAGDVANGKLSNVDWGNGITDAGKTALYTKYGLDGTTGKEQTAQKVADAVAAINTDAAAIEFANAIGTNVQNGTAINCTADGTINFQNLDDGYYMIVDTWNGASDAENGKDYTLARFMIQLAGTATVNNKADKPTVEKKIVEGSALVDGTTENIGDTVNYKLTSKVPEYSGYKEYYMDFTDVLSKGLTYTSTGGTVSGVTVKIGDYTLTSSDFTVTVGSTKVKYNDSDETADATQIKIHLKDFVSRNKSDTTKYKVGDVIEITYAATINDSAVIGVAGNPNKAKLEYSNNPLQSGDGTPDNEDDGVKGTTPWDEVKSFVTEIQLKKVIKGTTDPLAGAVFSITASQINKVIVHGEKFVEDANGGYWLLKNNKGYTTKAPTELTRDQYENMPTEGLTATKKYAKQAYATTSVGDTTTTTYEVVTGTDGIIRLTGLKEGTYTFTEIQAPDGYNLLTSPIVVEITSNIDTAKNDPATFAWSAKKDNSTDGITVSADGKISFNVENGAGSTLPSTGGIGTTIFYVAGSILVLAAAILLITKRRMGNND